MATIAIAIALTHEGFGAIVLAFHEAVREASRQKVKEGQDFSPPVAESRQGFAQFCRAVALHRSNPRIQESFGSSRGSGGIPRPQRFFELPSYGDLRKGGS